MTPSMPSHPPTPMPAKQYGVNWSMVGLAALLLVPLLPVAGFLLWLFAGPNIDPARSAADRFVQHLQRNEDQAAYLSSCSRAQDRITFEQFTEQVERLGRPVSHTLGHAGFADEAGRNAFVTVWLTDRSGRTTPLDLFLEGDAGWCVRADTLG